MRCSSSLPARRTVDKHDYTHKRQTGGSGQFAKVQIAIEPASGESEGEGGHGFRALGGSGLRPRGSARGLARRGGARPEDGSAALVKVLVTGGAGFLGGRIVKARGDKDHPTSQGYVCEKSQRMDFYQNGADRITSPKRQHRRPDNGSDH